jgi:3-phosphoshikimate 1-carboxyvinyltransferase
LTVHGTGRLRGGVVGIDATASSQLLSALLLVGPRCVDGIDVRLTGASLPSRPHVEMTVAMLRHVGALVAVTPDRWQVAPGELSPSEHHIEPDLSGAAAFLAAAAATAGHVVVSGWPDRTTQAGALLPDLLAEMGTVAELGPAGLSLRGPATLRGADLDLAPCGELAPVIAALAVLAATPSRLRGIAHLRGHETDRLAAFAREVNALGGDVEVTDDGWLIRPRPLRGGTFRTYDDHRLAMAAAVIGLVVPGVELDDVATTRKTMPDFAARWSALVAGADHPA